MARHPDLAPDLGDAVASLARLGRTTAPAAVRAEDGGGTPGTLGGFRIVRELGRGGMGVVYEAEEVALRRRVALKVLPQAAVLDPRQLRRFRQEAQAAALLHHPNVVGVHSVGSDGGVPFYAMEFVEGESLAHAIRERRAGGRPFDATDVARLGLQAAEALHYAHVNGVVHRDVKPGNLLVDAHGHLWVADFGLARAPADASLTASGDLLGTMRYMSPEQARRRPADARSDVYSLGATLYELLTLEPAVPGEDPGTLLRDILEREPVPPRRKNPAVPASLDTVVSKALAKDPAARYPTAADLAADLRRFLAGEPVAARRPGPAQRLGAWTRRHRGLVGAAAAALVLTSAALAVGLVRTEGALRVAASERTAAREALARARVNGLLNASEVATRSDPVLGLLLAREAARASREPDVLRTVRAALLACLERTRLEGHEAALQQARFLGPGERILTVSYLDSTVRTWDRPGSLLATARPYPRAVAVAPAGDRVFVASDPVAAGEWAALWSPDGRRLSTLRGAGGRGGRAAVFSADGSRLLVACDDGTARMWPGTGEGEPVLFPHPPEVDRVAVSPDGGHVLTASSEAGDVRLWRGDGAPVAAIPTPAGSVASIGFAAGGQRVVVATRSGALGCWDLAGRAVASVRTAAGETVTVAQVSPDGRHVVAGTSGGAAWLWDLHDSSWLPLRGHASGVTSAAFLPGRRLVATGSLDRSARVWDLEGRTVAVLRGHEGAVVSVAFAEDGTVLTAGDDGTARLWDLRAVEPVAVGDEPLAVAAVSPDGTIAAGTRRDSDLLLFAADGSLRRTVGGHTAPVSSAAFSPDGAVLATGSDDGAARLWTASGEPIAVLAGHATGPVRASVSPAGDRVLTVGRDRGVRLWDLAGRETGTLRGRALHDALFAPDGGAVLLVEPDGTLRLQEAGGEERVLARGSGSVRSCAWSPDGERLLAWSSDRRDPVLGIWRRDGTAAGGIAGHTDAITSASFSPRGDRIATASADGTTRIWTPDGTPLAVLRARRAVRHAAFAPSGDRLVVASEDGAVRVFDPDGRPVDELPQPGLDVRSVAFTRDGRRALTLAHDAPALLWDLDPDEVLRRSDARVLRDLTPAERVRYRDLLGPANEVRIAADEALAARREERIVREEVIDAIRADASLSEDVRAEALALAAGLRDDPQRWNRLAWTAVRGPGNDAKVYAWGLRLAEAAHRVVPEDAYVLNTVGIGRFRVGRHEEALEALRESDRRNAASPAGRLVEDVAGLALVLRALGRDEEARAERESLAALLATPRYAHDSSRRSWLEEVDAALSRPR